MSEGAAKSRYARLKPRRDPFVLRARGYAEVTIPSLLPPEGQTQMQTLPDTYQGFGARVVTALSSRITTGILPPGMPSFVMQVPPEILQKSGETTVSKDVEQGLAMVEQTIHREIERRKWRAPTNTAIQHLVVTGNAMEQVLPDNTIRVFRLDQYVVVRDPVGNMIEFITEELLIPASLPKELSALAGDVTDDATSTMPLYTWGTRDADTGEWTIHQEFNGKEVPDSRGDYTLNPFSALRWTSILGEDYGRSKVEDHYGDFRALEGLSRAMVDGAAMASRNITMIRPNAAGGLNLRRRMAKARNGEYVIGNPEDVVGSQFQNQAGLQFTAQALESLKAELAQAFLVNSSARRDAERVTAYELRVMIEELESVLGGVFTNLVQDLQENRLNRLILQMKDAQALPPWPEGLVEPVILTGLEALGREKDVQRATTALQLLAGIPPEVAQAYVKWPVILGKAFNGIGIPDAVNTETEAQENRQKSAMLEAAASAATSGATAQQ